MRRLNLPAGANVRGNLFHLTFDDFEAPRNYVVKGTPVNVIEIPNPFVFEVINEASFLLEVLDTNGVPRESGITVRILQTNTQAARFFGVMIEISEFPA